MRETSCQTRIDIPDDLIEDVTENVDDQVRLSARSNGKVRKGNLDLSGDVEEETIDTDDADDDEEGDESLETDIDDDSDLHNELDEEFEEGDLDSDDSFQDEKLDIIKHSNLSREGEINTDDPVSLYLREMARVPLLTSDQEVSLAQSMERGKLAQEKLCQDNFSPAEYRHACNQIEEGKLARAHLIKANTRLVVSVAKRYRGHGVPFLDLIQEGNMGLMRAADKFDYKRGHKFSTYATWWIRQAITRALSDQGRTIRLPVHMGDRIRQVQRVSQQIEQRCGQKPTPEEIAAEMEIDCRKVRWMLRVSHRPFSLEKPVGEDEDSELGSFIEDRRSPSPSEIANDNMLKEKMEELLHTLTPREARILRLRFGLDNGQTYTLEEIGRKFGLTRERIRQIQMEALRKLRHPSRSRRLKGYLPPQQ